MQGDRLKINSALKDEFGRPGQPHLGELAAGFVEADFQFVTALHLNSYRRPELVYARGNQGRGGHARAASQRFAFDPALKGADYQVSNIITEAFGNTAETNEILKKYVDCFAQGMNIVNLNLVQDLGK